MPSSDSSTKAGGQRAVVHIMQYANGGYGVSGKLSSLVPFAVYVPAKVAPLSAKDTIRSGQTTSEVAIPIEIRFIPGVTAGMVVQRVRSLQGQYYVVASYVIQGVNNVDELDRKLVLSCLALGSQNQ